MIFSPAFMTCNVVVKKSSFIFFLICENVKQIKKREDQLDILSSHLLSPLKNMRRFIAVIYRLRIYVVWVVNGEKYF